MLRVLKPGGTIAFSTWPPEFFVARMFALVARYMPPPPGVAPPPAWGDPSIVRQRLGAAVKDIVFTTGTMLAPALSVQHQRTNIEKSAGPTRKLVETLAASDPVKLETFRAEYDAIASEYFDENVVRQDYLITRATKI